MTDDLLKTPTPGKDMTKVLFPEAPTFTGITPRSPRLSFKGWALGVWLAKNKGFVKTVLAPCSAILTGGALEPGMLRPALVTAGLGLLTIGFKCAWDAFDYFVSEEPS